MNNYRINLINQLKEIPALDFTKMKSVKFIAGKPDEVTLANETIAKRCPCCGGTFRLLEGCYYIHHHGCLPIRIKRKDFDQRHPELLKCSVVEKAKYLEQQTFYFKPIL